MGRKCKLAMVALAAVTAFSFSACDGTEAKKPPTGEIEIWSKPSTVNVMRNVEYDDTFKEAARYGVIAGKGEYEAAQLIITVPAGMRAEYTIETCDLVCGEYKIDKSYIDVYNEKYINVLSSQATYSTGTGWYADALLPFDAAVKYGENTAGDDEELRNQGIYIETFVPRDIPAGEYTGSFRLTVNGSAETIPACVTVCDFTVSRESHLGQDWIVNLKGFGELDTTDAMSYGYFEAIAGYRASTHGMNMGAADADEWIQTVRKYTNPNLRDENGAALIGEKEAYLAAINLPAAYNADAEYGIDRKMFDTYISRLAYYSVKDGYDYLAKTSTYPGFIDEPHYNNTWDKVKRCCVGWNTYKTYWAEEIIATQNYDAINEKAGVAQDDALTQEDFDNLSAEFKEQLTKSMRLIGFHVTTKPDERLNRDVTTQFCKPVYSFNTAAEKYNYAHWTDVETSGDWAYAAGNSYFGNRLDSHPLEQRLMAYFMYATGTKGFLIWEVAQYQQVAWNADARANSFMPCDAYTMAQRISNGAGDGYILYPGKPYGIKGPVGSIRSHQYRDSSEEYEYLYYLNDLYSRKGYSAEKVLEKIFTSLYDENAVTDDTEIFALQRRQIINLILLAQKGVFVTDYSELSGKAQATAVSDGEENIVKINGESVTPCKEAVITADLTRAAADLSFETSAKDTFTVYTGGKVAPIQGTEKAAFTTEGGTAEESEINGTKSLKLSFAADESVEEDLRVYQTTFAADKNDVNRDIKRLVCEFYNDGDTDLLVELWFMGKDGRTVFVDDAVAYSGQYASVVTTRLDLVSWGTIRSLEGIRFKVTSPAGKSEYAVHFLGMYATK